MFDEMDLLLHSDALYRLLEHYARPGQIDREVWQDRLMAMGELEPRQLTRLHGELIAFSWLEQNTGSTPASLPGVVAGCYRVTPAGLRAFRQAGKDRPAKERPAARTAPETVPQPEAGLPLTEVVADAACLSASSA